MEKVDLLIIGAGRSGTTSLYHYLSGHPCICFSDIKEVHFFSIEDLYGRGQKYLTSYFTKCKNKKIFATADTYLLIDQRAPQRVLDYNPKMKFIALLREPVDRAYSSYNYAVNNGYESSKESFLKSLELEDQRLKEGDIIQKNNLCHFYGSLYHTHLVRWMEYFPKESFLILTTHDLENNLQLCLQKISDFLRIPSFPETEKIYVNKAAPVKSKRLQQFLLNRNHPFRAIVRPFIKPIKFMIIKSRMIDFMHRLNKKEKSYRPLSPEERKTATLFFQKDLQNLKADFKVSFPE